MGLFPKAMSATDDVLPSALAHVYAHHHTPISATMMASIAVRVPPIPYSSSMRGYSSPPYAASAPIHRSVMITAQSLQFMSFPLRNPSGRVI